MRLLASLLRPRARRAHKSTRAFRPAVVGLEERSLLSLSLVGSTPSFHVTAPPPSPHKMIEGNLGVVAVGTAPSLAETIDWGDGLSEPGWYGADPNIQGAVDIGGSHSYQSAGSYTITITVTSPAGDRLTWTDPVVVDPAAAPVPPPPTPAGPPTTGVIISLGTTPIIGGKFSIEAEQAPGKPFAPGLVKSTTWTIYDAYSADSPIKPDSTGYHYKPFNTQSVLGDTITGYWDAVPGPRIVSVLVTFNNPTWQGLPLPTYWPIRITAALNVTAPNGSLTPTVGHTIMTPDPTGGGGLLSAGDPLLGQTGITIDAKIDPKSLPPDVNGTYGVIQTAKISIVSQERDFVGAPLETWRAARLSLDKKTLVPLSQYPATWLDQLSRFQFPYYNFQSKPAGWPVPIPTPMLVGTGAPTSINDSPEAAWDENTIRIDVNDQFVDVLMFQPNGGLAVPLGRLTWSWRVSAQRADFAQLMAPTSPWSDITTTSYRASSLMPTWSYNGLTFLNPDNQGTKLPVSWGVPDSYTI